MSCAAIGVACAVSIPIGLGLGHAGKGELLAISISNVGRAVPSLALIAFFVAYLGVGFTNVMLALGSEVAVCCLDVIRNPQQRERVRAQLEASNRLVMAISESQLMSFGANVLELRTPSGPLLAVSARSWACYEPAQRRLLESHFAVNPVALDTIERVGGGGLRCMLAEIHLPARA